MAISAQQLAANKRFEFVSRAFGEDKFAVVKMSGFESISKPFRFTLTLVSDDPNIDFDKVLQNPAELRIFTPGGASATPYHGMVAAFEQLHHSDGYVFYQAVLVPRLWQMSLYQVSEVYLEDQPIPDTLKKVLEQGRLTGADVQFKLSGSYRKRSYVCQYQETHLDFLSRWMEKEGMYFYFDHGENRDKLVIGDNRSMHPADAVKVRYRPINQQDTGRSGDSVHEFVCRQEPLPRQVVLRDFNHRKAHIELKATAPVSDNGLGEINIYGENFRDEEEGKRYARLRAEEILCGARVFSGEATAVGLRSGYFMELERHYRDSFNGRYLVTEVQHEGSQAAALLTGQGQSGESGDGQAETNYHASFRAIPADTQFRPRRSTFKPKVIGTMNAVIDAEGPGEYAELDAYGQYKVQLPFDNSDKGAGKGSARVRMASPYAGSDHGMNFPLQKNAEVLLSFVDGDPDQPVILGAVPNSENPSIVNQVNPYQNKITTAGGNLIHMGDQKGKEVMWLHSPFHNTSIGLGSIDPKGGGSLWTSTGGSSESVTVGTSNSLFAGIKNSVTLSIDNSLTASMSNKMGIGSSVGFAVGYDVSWKKGKSVSLDDSTSYSLKTTGKLQGAESVTISGGQRMAVKAAVEAAKTSVQTAVMASMALNAVAAGTAGKYISDITDDKGKVDFFKQASGESINMARGIGVAGGALSAALVHGVMTAAAKTFAAVGTPEATYATNICLNDKSIMMSCDTIAPLKKGFVNIKNEEVSVKVGTSVPGADTVLFPKTEIESNANRINISVTPLAGITNQLFLSASQAKVGMANPDGVISLSHEIGGSVKLRAAGMVAEAGTSKLDMTLAGGATLTGGPLSKVSVLPAEVTASCGPSSMTTTASGVMLTAPGGKCVVATAAGVIIAGPLIRLG